MTPVLPFVCKTACREAETMINFDEEIAKYGPSLEISQAEEAVLSREIIDVADIIEKILQDKKDA
jgi:hypothetical protein